MQRWTSSLWVANRAFRIVFLLWVKLLILMWKGREWTKDDEDLSTLILKRMTSKRHGFFILVLYSDPCILGCAVVMTHRTVNARAALPTPCVEEWFTFLARSSTDLSDNLLLSDTDPPFSTDSTSNLRNTSAQNRSSFLAPLKNKLSFCAAMVPWRTFNICGTFPFYKGFFGFVKSPSHYTITKRLQRGLFNANGTEAAFWVPLKSFQWAVLKRTIFP